MGHGLSDVTGMYFPFRIHRASASPLSSARHTKITRPVEDWNYSHLKIQSYLTGNSHFHDFFFMVRVLVGQGLLIVKISRSQSVRHTTVSRTPLEEWSTRRRDLSLITHTTVTTDRKPHPRRASNLQSQQASGRRHTPLTARPLGPVVFSMSKT